MWLAWMNGDKPAASLVRVLNRFASGNVACEDAYGGRHLVHRSRLAESYDGAVSALRQHAAEMGMARAEQALGVETPRRAYAARQTARLARKPMRIGDKVWFVQQGQRVAKKPIMVTLICRREKAWEAVDAKGGEYECYREELFYSEQEAVDWIAKRRSA